LPEYVKMLILFGAGSLAGFINVNAGGGSTITLPSLIFMGLDSGMANGTNRIGILIQNIFAVSSFRKRRVHQFKQSLILASFTLPGAIVGAFLSVRLNSEWFQRILAIIMFGIVASMLFSRPDQYSKNNAAEHGKKWLIYPAMLGIGFYGGFIQAGVGFLLMASMYHLLKISLIHVNMHKVFIVSIYTIPAIGVFILTGNVNWGYGLILAAGTAFGGWWGARVAVKGGERIIRTILVMAILIMAIKLLGLF